MRKLIIVGAGGLGRETAWAALEMNRAFSNLQRWKLIGFADDNKRLYDCRIFDLPILGVPEEIKSSGQIWFHCAIGENNKRIEIAKRCLKLNWEPATIIHPSSIIANRSMIGRGTYVGAFCIINPNVTIGSFALINQRVAIGHDAIIEDWSQLNPGAQINGKCRVGIGATVGSNASLHPGITVGKFSVVGSNSQVVRNVADNITVNGVPARRIK